METNFHPGAIGLANPQYALALQYKEKPTHNDGNTMETSSIVHLYGSSGEQAGQSDFYRGNISGHVV